MKRMKFLLSYLMVFGLLTQNCIGMWGMESEQSPASDASSPSRCVGCKAEGCNERLCCKSCKCIESVVCCKKCHKEMKNQCCCPSYPDCVKSKGKEGKSRKSGKRKGKKNKDPKKEGRGKNNKDKKAKKEKAR